MNVSFLSELYKFRKIHNEVSVLNMVLNMNKQVKVSPCENLV